jgi:hypothetical protein
MVLTAILTMIAAFTLQHLGLTEAIAKVVTKIARCYMCTTFWSVLAVLILLGYDILDCVLLSALSAYVSNFMAFIYELLQMLYNLIDVWIGKLRKMALNQRLR